MPILSSLQPLNRSIEFESKLYEPDGIPAVIRIVSVTRPYSKNSMLLLRLRNVFDPVLDPRGPAGEKEALRSFPPRKKMISATEDGLSASLWRNLPS